MVKKRWRLAFAGYEYYRLFVKHYQFLHKKVYWLLFMDPDLIRYEILLIYIKISSKIDTVMYSKIYLGWELELCILSLYFHDVKLTKYLLNARYHSKSSFFYSVILVGWNRLRRISGLTAYPDGRFLLCR